MRNRGTTILKIALMIFIATTAIHIKATINTISMNL